jgi:hypothetical protein
LLLNDLVETSEAVSGSAARLVKIDRLSALLKRLDPAEAPIAVAYLSSQLRQRQIGVGYASMRDLPEAVALPSLTLQEVDSALEAIGALSGPASQTERRRLLAGLFSRATEAEQRFLLRLIVGELRQGALEGLMYEALARALDVSAREVRRAVMLRGDVGAVAEAGLRSGAAGLDAFRLHVGQPVQPMLAQSAASVAAALERPTELRRAGPRRASDTLWWVLLMIYEIRTYTVKPGSVAEYEKRFADGLRVRSRYSPLYGLWHTEIGPLNQIVHIWAYDSLQQRAETRAAASSDPSGAWPPKSNDLLVSQETDILVPIEGMHHHTGVQELGGVYELRMYTYPAGAISGVAETFAGAYPGRHAAYPVGGIWTSDLGNLNRLYQLFPYKNWAHRDQVRTELRDKHLWPPHAEARPVAQLVRHMAPAAFSPLR